MVLAPDDDIRLVRLMARGDSAALAALYDRYSSLMLAVAVRMLSDREAAEDLVHDVFLEAWRTSAEFDPGRGAVRSWLLVRLRSRALDRKRSGASTRMTHVADLAPLEKPTLLEEDPGLSPDRSRVRAVLGALPVDQRLVLELGYFEGLSSAEIAERLGVPVGTVKSRVAAALGRLRAVLGGTA